MYLAYKYARKKLRARKQKRDDGAQPVAAAENGPSTEANGGDDVGIVVGERDNDAAMAAGVANAGDGSDLSSQEAAEKKKRKRKYRWKIIFGLCAPFALQALDTTIIASALPFIAADFGECALSVALLVGTTRIWGGRRYGRVQPAS